MAQSLADFVNAARAKQGTGGLIPSLSDFGGLATGTATDGVHLAGTVADNKYVQAATLAALTASGVGAPAAAAIMAAEKGGGALAKDGGNIGDGLREGAKGAAYGYAAGKAGEALYNGVGGGAGGSSSTLGTLANMGKAAASSLVGGKGGAAGSDVPTWMKLLGLGGAAVGAVQGYNGAKANGAAQDAALERNTSISNTLQQHGTDIMAGQAPIRHAAETGLTGILAKGAPVTPTITPDTRNPFRRRFGPAVPPPAGV